MNKSAFLLPVLLGLASAPLSSYAHTPHVCPSGYPDAPVLPGHVSQTEINDGTLSFDEIFEAGKALMVAPVNVCDGQGRPTTTGTGVKRVDDEPRFIRTSAPESNACAGCHAQPRAGGGGDFVANVFVLAQAQDPVNPSVDGEFSNERNTLGMMGSGGIEMLSREMSADLQAQAAALGDGDHTLTTQGVDFEITIDGGEVTASRGVDTDLIIKPFHQVGVVHSLRHFTVNAFNHHHGMQHVERFDMSAAKGFDPDFDEDGVVSELSIGDATALSIFQAGLGVPGRLMPSSKKGLKEVARGEKVFDQVGCASCHMPEMTLASRDFIEPRPSNPPGTCNNLAPDYEGICPDYSFDMTEQGEGPYLEKGPGGTAIVRAYTDLKRHNLCDDEGPGAIRHFCNEQFAQGRPDQDGKPGTEFFLSSKLWVVGNSAPYGHRGDLTTITDAIRAHGGEARPSMEAYLHRSQKDQANVVKFLKTLQMLPVGSDPIVTAGD